MNAKQIAAGIFLRQQEKPDPALLTLEIINLSKHSDSEEILVYYRKLINEEILLCKVKSSLELNKEQKEKLEASVSPKFKKPLIFNYEINPELNPPLQINVGDNTLTFNSLNQDYATN